VTSNQHLNSSSGSNSTEYDIDILIEMYHHCYQKYLEYKSRLNKEKGKNHKIFWNDFNFD
jgi:hypothetical protein